MKSGSAMKKILTVFVLCSLLFTGCTKNDIAKTHKQSEKDGVIRTYYELKDGSWKCDDSTYQYRLELNGRMPNAAVESKYVVLTDNKNLSFEDVSKSLFSSLLEDHEIMEGSVIVEMN